MPLVNYRGSVEAVLRWECNDRVVSGLRWEQREGQRSCCSQHEYVPGCARNDEPWLGNFEIAYSTRRMTIDAVLGPCLAFPR